MITNPLDLEDCVRNTLKLIGEDPNREGLKETPCRVAKSYQELFSGYGKDPKEILKAFDGETYDQMILLKDIEFYSLCEHHMLNFFGKVHIAYIPNGKVIGVSKLARLVEIYSRRLQIQERMTTQIATALQDILNPLGVAVVVEAKHLCMMMRGIAKQNSVMKTAHLTGVFKDNKDNARAEFYSLIK